MDAMRTLEYITRQDLVEQEEQVKRRWKSILVLLVLASRVSVGTPAEAKPVSPDLPARREAVAAVLLISADPSTSSELSNVLQGAGFKVVATPDLSKGLADIGEFSLIILDSDLPDCEDVCLRIREQSPAPMILVGSDPSGRAWDRAVEMGADAYLMRTVSRGELVARLKAILRRYKDGVGAKGGRDSAR